MRVLIADDELLARRRLRRLLAAMADVEVVGEAADGGAVLAAIAEGAIDVVLLDIRMPGLSGVEAMQLWPAEGPAIVFVTAHAEHAVDAFAGGAVDYVLKPVDAGRLRKALDRALDRVGQRARTRPESLPDTAPRIALATARGVVLFASADIVCATIEGATVRVDTDRGPVFTDLSLSELGERLGDGFRRLHRQALVNLSRVERFEDNGRGGYLAHTDAGQVLPVSRKIARALRREWGLS